MKLKMLGAIIPVLFLVGCGGKVDASVSINDFNTKLSAGDYSEAGKVYGDNKENEEFKEGADAFIKSDLANKEKYLNTDNCIDLIKEVELIDEFYDGESMDNFYKKADALIKEKEEKELAEKESEKQKLEEEITKLEEEKKNLEAEKNKQSEEKESSKKNNGSSRYGNFSYKTYANPRFGFSIKYPSFLIEEIHPSNGDGIQLKSADGTVSLTASGINNVLNYTAKSMFDEAVNSIPNISYKHLGKSSYVISWTEGNYNYYQKTSVGSSSINSFILRSPVSEAEAFNSITTTIYNSFKTGDLNSCW